MASIRPAPPPIHFDRVPLGPRIFSFSFPFFFLFVPFSLFFFVVVVEAKKKRKGAALFVLRPHRSFDGFFFFSSSSSSSSSSLLRRSFALIFPFFFRCLTSKRSQTHTKGVGGHGRGSGTVFAFLRTTTTTAKCLEPFVSVHTHEKKTNEIEKRIWPKEKWPTPAATSLPGTKKRRKNFGFFQQKKNRRRGR